MRGKHSSALTPALVGLVSVALTVTSCDHTVERNVIDLGAGGDVAAEARQALLLSKELAVDPLLSALPTATDQHRRQIIEALTSLATRIDDPRIAQTLNERLCTDQSPDVRALIARRLGLLGKADAVEPLLKGLSDVDGKVRHESFMALHTLEPKWTKAQRRTVKDMAVELERDAHEGVRIEALVRLTTVVEDWLREAATAALSAQVAEAESLYLEALTYYPASARAHYRLGRHYYDSGNEKTGLEYLRQHGMVIDVPKFPVAPRIDGVLEGVWSEAARVDRFRQLSVEHPASLPAMARTSVHLGYTDEALFIGFVAHDPRPDSLVSRVQHHDDVSVESFFAEDRCEIHVDPGFDHRGWLLIAINSLGMSTDEYVDSGFYDRDWDNAGTHAARVGNDRWVAEYRLDFGQQKTPQAQHGDVWGFNAVRSFRGQSTRSGFGPTRTEWFPTSSGYCTSSERA